MRKGILPCGLAALWLSACGGQDNHPPTGVAQTITTAEDTVATGTLSGTDPDGDPLTFTVSQQAAHGTATVQSSGAFTYLPAANYNGTDSFQFAVTDSHGAAAHAVVTITITPVNDAPTLAATTIAGVQDQDVSGTVPGNDVDGDTLTYAVTANPTHGSLVSFDPQGQFTYRPAAGFHGIDSFGVSVTDPSGLTATGTITITIKVDGAPQAVDDIVTVASGNPALVDVLANDSDPEGDALAVSIISAPSVGTATVTADNRVSLTVPSGFRGFTRFTYRATDPSGLSSSASAVVFVGTPVVRLSWTGDEVVPGTNGIAVSDFLHSWSVSANLASGETLDYSSPLYRPRADTPMVGFRTTGGAYVARLDHPGSASLIASDPAASLVDIDVHSSRALYVDNNVLSMASLDGSPSVGAINAPNYCNGAFGPTGIDVYVTCAPPVNTFPPPTPYVAPVASPNTLTVLAGPVGYSMVLPDDSGLLYYATRTDSNGTFTALFKVLKAAPGQEVQVSGRFTTENLFSFRLTPDGTKAVYSASGSTGCELYESDLTGTPASVHLNGPHGPNSCPVAFDLSPDSQRVVYWQVPVGQPLQEAVYETSLASPFATTTIFTGGIDGYSQLQYDETGTDLLWIGQVDFNATPTLREWHRAANNTVALTSPSEIVSQFAHNDDWSILSYLVKRDSGFVYDERVMNRAVPGQDVQISSPAGTSGVVNFNTAVFYKPVSP